MRAFLPGGERCRIGYFCGTLGGIDKLCLSVPARGSPRFESYRRYGRTLSPAGGGSRGWLSPAGGGAGGGKGTRKQCGKNQKPMKPIITPTTNGCSRLQTACVIK